MTGRTVKEWVGSSPDAAIPPRVRIRVVERFDKRCAECRRMLGGKLGCEIDHIQALCNGGQHRESNLQPLCIECHAPKTAADRKMKAKSDRLIKRELGIKPKSSRRFNNTYKGRPIKQKIGGGVVYRDSGERVK